jgi:hypothetical protein
LTPAAFSAGSFAVTSSATSMMSAVTHPLPA